ncbi:hypothetical protein [Streptomyces sp. NPDC026673]|uniref:hypothetical protein n=1 Tax=Streptomyces sp. NPDC026673 TaxID=3155724 RepID=UPI0033C82E0B
MEGNGRLRALRAGCFAALCVTLSATAHIMLSREPLPLTTTAGAFAAVFAVAYALGRRERGYWLIAGLLVPLELAVDTLFTAGQHTCYGPGGGPVTGSWRSINEALVCHGDVGGALTTAPGVSGPTTSPWLLLLAHVCVGLVAAGWLRGGEDALHRLLRAAFRPLLVAVAAFRAAEPRGAAGRRPAGPLAAVPALPLLLHSVVRRGPPARLGFR